MEIGEKVASRLVKLFETTVTTPTTPTTPDGSFTLSDRLARLDDGREALYSSFGIRDQFLAWLKGHNLEPQQNTGLTVTALLHQSQIVV